MTTPPPLLMVVGICDDPAQLCAVPTCPLAADLVVKPHRKTAARGDSWWCVKHWGLLRRLLVRRRYGIHYGEGVPERIAARLGNRLSTIPLDKTVNGRRNPPRFPLDHEPEAVTYVPAPRGALSYPRCSREELEGGFWV